MNAKNLLTQRIKSSYKMDKTSERYRKCPNDGHEFMTNNLSRIYCSEQCADEFHNQKKRLAAEKLMQEEIDLALKAPMPLAQEEKANEPIETVQTEAAVVTSPLVGNINLIGATLGNRDYLKVYKKYLTERGVDYGIYDNKYQLPGSELNVLTYGPYAIAWGYENHIIITYKKNIPWIQ